MSSLSDPGVPALEMLLGGEHRELLDAVVASSDGSVESSRIGQVRYVPGRSVTVQYETRVRFGAEVSRHTFVAVSGAEVPADVVRVESSGVEVAMWRYPHDPYLPGLPSAADRDRAAELLAELGAPTSHVDLRRRAYRAGRRAVIEARGSAGAVYLKVIRPHRVAPLQELHTTMARHLPVPRSLGWSDRLGVVALQALDGTTLRKAIEGGAAELPSAAALCDLLDRIPVIDRRAAPGPGSRTSEHAAFLATVMPNLRDRLGRLEAAIAEAPGEALVPVHGDFHASQVLTVGSTITGLVDVDTAGIGERSDDLAGLLAQLSVLAQLSAQRHRFAAYGGDLIGRFDTMVDPRGLRLRVAAAVVGFATGPFRVQLPDWREETDRRVSLAERWVTSASFPTTAGSDHSA